MLIFNYMKKPRLVYADAFCLSVAVLAQCTTPRQKPGQTGARKQQNTVTARFVLRAPTPWRLWQRLPTPLVVTHG